ncbi:MAG TPA: c-type cytochrome [Vicinamibacterales bacterium]|jgi:mono/diheme cytochrome c family protein|nr:c-type cytochrome [Vicinamibacterales bacterium]
MPRRGVIVGLIFLLAGASLQARPPRAVRPAAVGRFQSAVDTKNPIAATPESIAAGKQTYVRTCAPCHGTSGEGGPGNDLIPAAPDLTDAMWDHGSTDAAIFTNIKEGIGPDFNMTPFQDRLKDEEIWNVVNYLRTLARK